MIRLFSGERQYLSGQGWPGLFSERFLDRALEQQFEQPGLGRQPGGFERVRPGATADAMCVQLNARPEAAPDGSHSGPLIAHLSCKPPPRFGVDRASPVGASLFSES